jgi:hypothetical protein
MSNPELPIQVLWERILGDILDRTMKFPRHARFTFASRIDGLALDILDRLVAARYARSGEKAAALREVDGLLSRLRVLLRVAHDRKYLSTGGLEHVARKLDEAGRMLGGWQRQLTEPA